ncbi:MAG: hypothetical protein J0I84_14255 [Terrimonas sp.]|nr:hypothetical protein [Terrimonas sp.]OJY96950.1 MAG: hypothetical protein BGP13_25040 [Sphingobacteriales bacterium 40-81]
MWRYFLCWFPMLILAIINGSARDLWYKKYVGEIRAHQISTFSLVLLFGIYIWIVMKKIPVESEMNAILLGLFWLILTLVFEFGFGLMQGSTMSQLLGEYNIMKGRVWVLIPIWVSFAPYLFFKIQSR